MKNIQVNLLDNQTKKEKDEILTKFILTQNNYVPSNIAMVNAPFYWQQGYKGKGIKIAVIDTGCIKHPNLPNIIGGKNFTDEGIDSDYTDYNSHGTHCAGVIGGNGNILGIAPESSLLILKVLKKDGNGNAMSVINAINYAVEQKVDVISMSLGLNQMIPELHQAVKNAVANNIAVVCASGNNGDDNPNTNEVNYPAGYEEVISVGAIDMTRKNAKFTNSNQWVDCVAPGVGVVSTCTNNAYCSMDGTSMATPHVAGVVALIIEKFIKEWNRKPTESEIYGLLVKNTLDIPNMARTIQGHGMIYLR